jgi:hypothetical protein
MTCAMRGHLFGDAVRAGFASRGTGVFQETKIFQQPSSKFLMTPMIQSTQPPRIQVIFMDDANTRGTVVWIHRVLATWWESHVCHGVRERFRTFGHDSSPRWDSTEHRVTREPSLT